MTRTRRFFAVLDEALQYTFDHFSFEESLLQARGFGRLTQHKSLHDDIRSGAQAMKINWDVVSPKLVKDLMAQIVAHITQADMEYVGHI